jgi:hypothetical protein
MATIISTKTSGVGGLSVTGDASGILQLASADGTTALTINASQNVGIGTSSPTNISGNGDLTVLNRVFAGVANASYPSYSFIGRTDSGMWSPSASTIAFSTGFTERMRIDSSGNVGIGTSSPSTYGKLAVSGNLYAGDTTSTSDGTITIGSNGAGSVAITRTGTGATNSAMTFSTTFSTLQERMRIDSSGNVGIGTSSPLAKLDVSSTTLSEIRATISSVGAGNVARLALKSPVASYAWYVADNTNALVLYDYNATTERMRIDSSGNVGIGTSSPTQRLTVIGSGQTIYFGSATRGIMSQDSSGRTQFYAVNPAVTAFHPLTIDALDTVFATSSIERARINASGQFLIGTSGNFFGENLTVYNNNASTAPVAFFYNPNPSTTGSVLIIQTEGASGTTWKLIDGRSAGGAGRFFVFGNGNVQNSNNSYGAISDESVKESIVDATHKLDDLCKVKIRNFNLKNDENKIKQIGVVAQELEQIFPAMVEEVDGLKGVKYSIFVPILVKAIQELKAIIDTQNARITTLEGG